MEYATLGKTGRKVSRIGFGGATAGLKNYLGDFDPSKKDDREAILESIGTALAVGINYFDTAPGYGDGQSERLFGEGLQGADADRLFLATKVGLSDERPVRASLEASLKRLRRDRVDLLQLHGTVYTPDQRERILKAGGMLDQLLELKEDGLIRHVGFTGESINRPLLDLLDTGQFDVIQFAYNLLFQHPYDPSWKGGLFYDAEAKGMGIVTMRSLTSGIFQRWIRQVNPDSDFDYAAPLIQFQLSNPLVDVALLGMRSAQEVRQNAAIADDCAGRIDIEQLFRRYVGKNTIR